LVFGVVYYFGQRTNSGPTLAERTLSAAEEGVRQEPNNIQARLALANAYFASNRQDDALAQFAEIVKVEPTNRLALLGSAQIRFSQGDLDGAAKEYSAVVKASGGQEFSAADPQLQEAYYFLGTIAFNRGDMKSAVSNLENALMIDKTDADAWFRLGEAQLRAGDPEKSIAAYQEAISFVPTGWCDPYRGLASAYTKLSDPAGVAFAEGMGSVCAGDADAGIAKLKGLTDGPFAIQALIGLGQAAENTGKLSDAAAWYGKAKALDPKNVAANSGLARVNGHGAASTPSNPTGSPS
jgi:tetratricopeptide (TPR) repeat protein